MNTAQFIARVRGILSTPRTEWPLIASMPATVRSLYLEYVCILAAIAAVAQFLSNSVIGTSVPILGHYRVGLLTGMVDALFIFVVTLTAVYLSALIIHWLAPRFGGSRDQVQALKTVAYSYTAVAAASVAALIPIIGNVFLLVGCIYSIYLIKLGLPHTMKCVPGKAGIYTATSLLCNFLLGLLLGPLLVFGLSGSKSMVSQGMTDSITFSDGSLGSRLDKWQKRFDGKLQQSPQPNVSEPQAPSGTNEVDNSEPPGSSQLERWAKQIEEAGKQMEKAQAGGDTESRAKAMGEMLGAVLGGADGKVNALSLDRIKSFAPEALAGWQRRTLKGERNAAMGIQVTTAKASYEKGPNQHFDLEITDTGTMKGLVGMAQGWLGLEQESESDDGYEKTYRDNGRLTHEKWNNNDSYGEYSVVVGERFAVKVSGHAGSIADLKTVVASLDLAGLEALKDEGKQTRQDQ